MIRAPQRSLLVLGLTLAAAAPAAAGPPFVTDDPEPTERGRWEIYQFVSGARAGGETAGEAGLDLNYGGAEDLQLTLVIPAAFEAAGGHSRFGMGVTEAAAKYKVVHQSAGGWTPDLAIFPRVFIPTAPARFASRRVNVLLPVWGQKDFGAWSVFGGGGYQFNPGAENRDFWVAGLTLLRQVNPRLALGAEVFHHTRDANDARAFTGATLGATYKLTDHWSLLASGGPGLQNARREGRYQFYLSLLANY